MEIICVFICLSVAYWSAQIVGQILLEFTMGDFLLKAFGQFQYSAVLTHSEFRFNWGHMLILFIVE